MNLTEVRKCPSCGYDALVMFRVRVNTAPTPCWLVRTRCLLDHVYDDFEDMEQP